LNFRVIVQNYGVFCFCSFKSGIIAYGKPKFSEFLIMVRRELEPNEREASSTLPSLELLSMNMTSKFE
jgi:hypothetical protein